MNLADTIDHEIRSPDTALRFIYARVDDDRPFHAQIVSAIVVTLKQMHDGLPDHYRYFAELRTLPRFGRRSKEATAELVKTVILDRNLI